MSTTLPTLPDPVFVSTDPAPVLADMIASFEAAAGVTLQPAQVERLMIDLIQYREVLIRQAIQSAAMQNLVRYAVFPMLDLLGELVNCPRLLAQPAGSPFLATLTAAQAFDVLIPAGTRVQSNDGKVVFATADDLTIAAGQTTGTVNGTAQTAGIVGNDYLAGAVSQILDPVANLASLANSDTTGGGSDQESNDDYRLRIMQAPESFSVAGPAGAYQYFAKSANPTICDVAVLFPGNNQVSVYVLTQTGLPSAGVLTDVETALDPDKVVPQNDLVSALAPAQVDYQIVGDLTVYKSADSTSVYNAVLAAVQAYVNAQELRLGRDIIPDQPQAIGGAIAGVYKFAVTSPAADQVLDGSQWGHCTGITINLVGAVDG